MPIKERLSASVDATLFKAASLAAARGGAPNLSAWVSDALRLKLAHEERLQALAQVVAAFEAEHGEITQEEMRHAARRARARAVVVRGSPARGVRRPHARGNR